MTTVVKRKVIVNGKEVDPDSEEYKRVKAEFKEREEKNAKEADERILVLNKKKHKITSDKQFNELVEKFKKDNAGKKITTETKTKVVNGHKTVKTKMTSK